LRKEDREAYKATYGPKFWSNEKIIPMPVLTEEYPRAAVQLDGLVENTMRSQKSLDWALDNLKPSSGPAASLPDSIRREMLYYLYHDNFYRIKKPWSFGDEIPTDFYFSGGTGTSDKGWFRYADIDCAAMEEAKLWLGSYCTIYWARSNDTLMDSARAMRLFNHAIKEDMLVSRLSNPEWSPILSFEPCVYHEYYELPAYCIEIPVEYDCCEEYPNVYRRQDTMVVVTCIKDNYEYLISHSKADGGITEFLHYYLTF